MFTVKEKVIATIEVERSKFIAILLPLPSVDEIKSELEVIRSNFPNARHYVYGAKTNDGARSSDDGEPSGTAGRPLLNLLHTHELNNVLLVVVRYFGGVKLGAGRLLRTYVEAGQAAINEATVYELVKMKVVHVEVNYRDYEIINSQLDNLNASIDAIDYNITVTFKLLSENDLEKNLMALTSGQAKIRRLEDEFTYKKVGNYD